MSARVVREGEVAVVLLDDSDRRNALSSGLVREVLAGIESTRGSTRALVLGGNGPVFCAGADLRELVAAADGCAPTPTPHHLFRAIEDDPRVVIAAIDGPALGGGFELCLVCDLVVAAEGTWFQLPEVSAGVVPNTALARLPAMVGSRRALDLVVTRRRLPVDEAHDLGVVNRVVPAQTAIDHAVALGHEVVQGAPAALRLAKRTIGSAGPSWDAIEDLLQAVDPDEAAEGAAAFAARRPPEFTPFWKALGDE